MAFLSIFGQILIQYFLTNQLSDSKIVNYAGRQRFQSQEIVKNILILTQSPERPQHQKYLKDLIRVLPIWEQYQAQLKSGDLRDLDIKVENSSAIKKMFAAIDTPFTLLASRAHLIMNYLKLKKNINNPTIKNAVGVILANEMRYLQGMDSIVFQFDKEAKAKVALLKKMELILLCITLFILLLEGLFIFRPIVNQVKNTIKQLIISEQKTHFINQKLTELNLSLSKAEDELLSATKEKYQHKIEQQKTRSASLIEGQEEERKRLALELHDGLGQMLTALKLNIENIEIPELTDQLRHVVLQQKEIIKETISTARSISFNLMPAALNDFGLDSALKILVKQVITQSTVQLIYSSDFKVKRLDKNIEIGLYRIAQEGINNSIKYANSTEILINLSADKNMIGLSIYDNGKGFNIKAAKNDLKKGKVSQGIGNMKERTRLLDGIFNIDTKPGEGTKIIIKIPIKSYVQNKNIVSG